MTGKLVGEELSKGILADKALISNSTVLKFPAEETYTIYNKHGMVFIRILVIVKYR